MTIIFLYGKQHPQISFFYQQAFYHRFQFCPLCMINHVFCSVCVTLFYCSKNTNKEQIVKHSHKQQQKIVIWLLKKLGRYEKGLFLSQVCYLFIWKDAHCINLHSLCHRPEGSEVERINYFFIIIYKVIYLRGKREQKKKKKGKWRGVCVWVCVRHRSRERPEALSFKLGPGSHYLPNQHSHNVEQQTNCRLLGTLYGGWEKGGGG